MPKNTEPAVVATSADDEAKRAAQEAADQAAAEAYARRHEDLAKQEIANYERAHQPAKPAEEA